MKDDAVPEPRPALPHMGSDCAMCDPGAIQQQQALRHASYRFDGRGLRGWISVRGEDGDRRRTAEKGVRGSLIHANTDEHFSK